jgi:hypothetical protein
VSFQGNLFIPRKDYASVPDSTTIPEDLKGFLRDLISRQRTNDLAVQRWANYPGIVVVGTSGASVVAPTTFTLLPLGAIQTTASQKGVASSSASTITIPSAGWYTIGATVIWNDTLTPSTGIGYLNFSMVNAANPSVPLTEGPPVYLDETIGGAAGFPYQSISDTRTYAKGEVLEFRVLEFGLPGINVSLLNMVVRREGVIPSSVG